LEKKHLILKLILTVAIFFTFYFIFRWIINKGIVSWSIVTDVLTLLLILPLNIVVSYSLSDRIIKRFVN